MAFIMSNSDVRRIKLWKEADLHTKIQYWKALNENLEMYVDQSEESESDE